MRWFRSNRTFGGCLALAALALQIALSFAHLHPQDVFGSAQGARLSLAAHSPSAGARDDVPSVRRDSRAAAEAYCDVCASINLLASSQSSDAPRLLPPQLLGNARPALGDDATRVARRYVLFQSRAPPTI